MKFVFYKVHILWMICWFYGKLIQIAATPSRSQNAAIISGKNTGEGEFPWHVVLMRNDNKVCGGSIISDKWILTAAKCVYDINKIELLFGTVSLSDDDHSRWTDRIFIHPDYKGKGLYNDIALLELLQPLLFDKNIQPIKLLCPNDAKRDFVNSKAFITGFGKEEDNAESGTHYLLWANVKIIDNRKCASEFNLAKVEETLICSTGYKDISAPCGEDDAGGALVWKDENHLLHQIGIISYSVENKCSKFPATYTRISSFMDWIQDITGLPCRNK